MDDIPWKFNNSSLLPDAQDIITELLRKNPAHRLGTGGAREIKSHPFLSNIDFNNLLSKEPQFVPDFESEEDTGYFDTRCSRYQHNDSDEEDQSEDNDWPESQNFVSSSVRLSKLCSNNTTMMNNEEAESPPGYSPESAEHSDMQKESSSKSDSENQYSTAKGSKSPPFSEFPFQELRKSVINLRKQQNTENVEDGERRRGSIFRRMISSCRRKLSRAAHTIRESGIFALCQKGSIDISRAENLQV
ncbi:microtubule-associated serine/threonine-protein kinase 2-like [Anomaloglossus baeobatrachus]|uniref:microtubule-associated serine/threonine-protein kinase 2-like n=1 Tax=Anomaloglossus baeobatrachus TaxID=238106 RepID=UPI003F505A98